MHRIARMPAVACMVALVCMTGCTSIGSTIDSTVDAITPSAPKPWVKPYERQNLADEIMSDERFPLDTAFMSHLRQSREGARGAEGGGGGGCGCN